VVFFAQHPAHTTHSWHTSPAGAGAMHACVFTGGNRIMIKTPTSSFDFSAEQLAKALAANDIAATSKVFHPLGTAETLEQLERLNTFDRALAYRTLPKDRAMEVFERL